MNLFSKQGQPTCSGTEVIMTSKESITRLAANDTLHCLLTCGIGEVLGMIIAAWLGMSIIGSLVLEILLGFLAGFTFGFVLLIKRGVSLRRSLRIVLVAEGLSILVMEAFIALTQVMIPGLIEAHLTDSMFWAGMTLSLTVGFIAAFPVNYVLAKNGVRHKH